MNLTIKYCLLSLIIISGLIVHAQVEISGKIQDRKGDPLTGVNVYLDGTYAGATTDVEGLFSFKTDKKGENQLIASFVGFKTHNQTLNLSSEPVYLSIVLKESTSSLDAVVITAGTFEASDEKKAVIFKPLDIVTTAGGLADIPSAINTLPGTQTVGEEGKLFVRGGDSYETQTYMDGMIVDSPYESTMPDVPSRGRFSPWLFKGTIFSSGGYSAEYGQALSSALILKTNDLPAESITSLSFMSVGAGASHTKKWKNTSISLSADYFNLAPYFALVPQNFDWREAPSGLGSTLIFRQKVNKNGMIKAYGQLGNSTSKMNYPGIQDVSDKIELDLLNNNAYFNATYNDHHGKKFISEGGISYSYDKDIINLTNETVTESINNKQYRYNLSYLANESIVIKVGGDLWARNFGIKYENDLADNYFSKEIRDNIISGFTEGEIKFTRNFAVRAGVRAEYSDYLNTKTLAPRFSLAHKIGAFSQVSFAYGQFYQSPRREYLVYTNELNNEQASHYILNFQMNKNNRIFRIETYYKDYKNLVKFDSLNSPYTSAYSNEGKGYAKGVDLFWRDNSFSNIDYWISYSYVDSKREYRDYPKMATPYFVSNHNLSVVYKHFLPKISSQIGMTYKYASGRPYYNPGNPKFMSDRTKAYNDLSFNFSYLTSIWDNFTIVHFSIGNVFGWEQSFGYRYSLNPDSAGNYESYEIEPGAKRFLFLGVFISI